MKEKIKKWSSNLKNLFKNSFYLTRKNQKLSGWFRFSKDLICLANSLKIVYQKKNQKLEKAFQGIVFFFFIKSYLTFKAIYILCKNGLGLDAGILLRSLLENVITLSYIVQDKEKRSQLYLKHSLVARKNLLDLIKKDSEWFEPMKDRLEKKEKEILQGYESVKNDYPNKYRWSNKTIMQMADEANLKTLRPANFDLSDIVHSGPLAMNKYMKEKSDGNFAINLNPKDDYVNIDLPVSCAYLIFILDKFNDVFELNHGK